MDILRDSHFAVVQHGDKRIYSCTGVCALHVPSNLPYYSACDGETSAVAAVRKAYAACGRDLATEILRAASRASANDDADFEGAFEACIACK